MPNSQSSRPSSKYSRASKQSDVRINRRPSMILTQKKDLTKKVQFITEVEQVPSEKSKQQIEK
jgi:hypothetical protein